MKCKKKKNWPVLEGKATKNRLLTIETAHMNAENIWLLSSTCHVLQRVYKAACFHQENYKGASFFLF